MNKYETHLFIDFLYNQLLFETGTIKETFHHERELKTKAKYYKQFALVLNKIKEDMNSNSDKKKLSHIKKEYSDNDIAFLKKGLKNGELTIFDLTYQECFLTKTNSCDYRRAQRKVFSNMFFSDEGYKIYTNKIKEIDCDLTPRLAYCLYKSISKKYPLKKK